MKATKKCIALRVTVTPAVAVASWLITATAAYGQASATKTTDRVGQSAVARPEAVSPVGSGKDPTQTGGPIRREAVGASREASTTSSPADGSREISRSADRSAESPQRVVPLSDARRPVAAGPTVFAAVRESQFQPGGSVTVDVYAQGVSALRLYQIAVDVTDGESGSLDLEDVWIDKAAADYVFGSDFAVDAVDVVRGRMGAVLWSGEVDVERPAYLGTYVFRASKDARGTFTVQVRAGEESFLATASNDPVAFRPGPDALVNVKALTHRNSNSRTNSKKE